MQWAGLHCWTGHSETRIVWFWYGQEMFLDEQQQVKRYHLNNLTIWEGICFYLLYRYFIEYFRQNKYLYWWCYSYSLQLQHVIQYHQHWHKYKLFFEMFDADFSDINVFIEPGSIQSQWSIATCKSRQEEIIILRIGPLN